MANAGSFSTASLIACIAAMVACGNSAPSASSSPPTDAATVAYVSLIHSYFDRYRTARGDAEVTCVEPAFIQPQDCAQRVSAMIPVWQNLLTDLDATHAPKKFSADDKIIRENVPKGILDLKKALAYAQIPDIDALSYAAHQYIGDMVPKVTGALADIDPTWRKVESCPCG